MKKVSVVESKYPLVKLGDACELKAGKFVSASDINDKDVQGLYPCFGGNGVRGYTSTFTHDGVFPLIGRQGALCGNVCLAQGKFHATEHAIAVTAKTNVDIKYLYYTLIELNLNQYAIGVAQPGLSVESLKAILLPLPPLNIQQEIVAACELVDGAVRQAHYNIAALNDEVRTVVKNLSQYSSEKIERIAYNWDSKRKPITASNRKIGVYPYYGASGIVDYVEEYLIDDTVLLISEDGANLKSRVTPIAFTAIGKIWVNNHAHILKFDNKNLHKLVELYLNHLDINEFITGMAQPKLSQMNLNRIKIPVPPLAEQTALVAKIEAIETKIAEAQRIIDQAPAQKQAVLRQYL